MILHSYFTNGFYEWALFYLETLRHYNNLLYPVVFNTVGLEIEQVRRLKMVYPNITVLNEPFELAAFSRRANIAAHRIAQYKEECENEYVTQTNRVWKLMTAGDDRIKALRNVLHQYHLQDFYVLHTDIDVYVRGKLDGLLDFMKKYDVCVKLRPKAHPVKTRITIDVMGYKISPDISPFLDDWVDEIDKVPLINRPLGFGQISCWSAYRKHKAKLNWGRLPLTYGLPGRTKSKDVFWCGNLHKVTKKDCLVRFKEDFERRKKAEL